jgi:hypothetical protein
MGKGRADCSGEPASAGFSTRIPELLRCYARPDEATLLAVTNRRSSERWPTRNRAHVRVHITLKITSPTGGYSVAGFAITPRLEPGLS